MSKMEFLGALEAEKLAKQKCKQYYGTPCKYTYTHKYTYTYTNTHSHLYTHNHTHSHKNIHTYTHTRIHLHTHIYAHTHTTDGLMKYQKLLKLLILLSNAPECTMFIYSSDTHETHQRPNKYI